VELQNDIGVHKDSLWLARDILQWRLYPLLESPLLTFRDAIRMVYGQIRSPKIKKGVYTLSQVFPKKATSKQLKMRPTCIRFGVTNPKDKPNQTKPNQIGNEFFHLHYSTP